LGEKKKMMLKIGAFFFCGWVHQAFTICGVAVAVFFFFFLLLFGIENNLCKWYIILEGVGKKGK